MVVITLRPLRETEITSRWTAAHNPLIYKFQRRDREITSVAVAGLQLRVNLTDTTGLIVGDSVYMYTTKYKGPVTIELVYGGAIWVTGLTLNGSDGAGFLNDSRRNYRIELNIYEVGNNKLLGSTTCVPFTSGAGTKDLSVYIASYLKLTNTFNYDVVNKRDVNGSIKFYITYQEKWFGGSGDLITDITQPIFGVNAAKQIGDVNGQNMSEFVLAYPSIRTAKFLTKFKRPVYFKDKPFALGFIYSELLAVTISKKENQLNINKSIVDDSTQVLDSNQKESVNFLMLEGDYPDNVKFIKLKLVSGIPVDSSYVYPGYVIDGYVAAT